MRVKIVPIGNSRGIRIPKHILDACDIGDEVVMSIEDRTLMLRAANRPREGWDEAFREATEDEPSEMLMLDDDSAEWDQAEWTW